MRAGVLIRSWLSALFSFFAVTAAFCIALVVAITGPPSWAELRGVGDNIGAAFGQISDYANRQIQAYNQARERPAPSQAEPEFDEAPPRMMAEAPIMVEEAPPQASDADDLAGGHDDPAPRPVAPVPPPRATEPTPLPPRAQSVEIAPPVETAERASLTEQLMDAVEALIPTLELGEEAGKPAMKDAAPPPDAYADEAYAAHEPAPRSAHEEVRARARLWAPQPGDRFPADERDLERWSRE